jgi:hypothetical protein
MRGSCRRSLADPLGLYAVGFRAAKTVSFRPRPIAVRVPRARRGNAGVRSSFASNSVETDIVASRMEPAGFERTVAWVRSRRSLASISAVFQEFCGRWQSLLVTNCRLITRGFLGYLVTGSAFCDQIRDR